MSSTTAHSTGSSQTLGIGPSASAGGAAAALAATAVDAPRNQRPGAGFTEEFASGREGVRLCGWTVPTPTAPGWLSLFFDLAERRPWLARALRPVAYAGVPIASRSVRQAIKANAGRIFGRELGGAEHRAFARKVVGSFYDFVLDVAAAASRAPSELASRVEQVEGLAEYRLARAKRRGAIMVTAHLGTFEVGLAALRREERAVRVVFKRDPSAAFERLRSRLHHMLGVIESPIDDGLGTWLALREALERDEVVVMQGDRAMPGQKSEVVPFLHGHMRLPTGPVRLAELTGAPIVPVFAVPTGKGRYKVLLKSPIEVANAGVDGGQRALRELAAQIGEVVADYPHQWLALEPVFEEDAHDARR